MEKLYIILKIKIPLSPSLFIRRSLRDWSNTSLCKISLYCSTIPRILFFNTGQLKKLLNINHWLNLLLEHMAIERNGRCSKKEHRVNLEVWSHIFGVEE